MWIMLRRLTLFLDEQFKSISDQEAKINKENKIRNHKVYVQLKQMKKTLRQLLVSSTEIHALIYDRDINDGRDDSRPPNMNIPTRPEQWQDCQLIPFHIFNYNSYWHTLKQEMKKGDMVEDSLKPSTIVPGQIAEEDWRDT